MKSFAFFEGAHLECVEAVSFMKCRFESLSNLECSSEVPTHMLSLMNDTA